MMSGKEVENQFVDASVQAWQQHFQQLMHQQQVHHHQQQQLDSQGHIENDDGDLSVMSPVGVYGSDIYDRQDQMENMSLAVRIVEAMPDYPSLWNTHIRSYRDLNIKEQAWKELQAKLSAPAEDIKKTCSKLRENYRKCLKKRERKTRSGAGSGKLPTCNFFNELQFLQNTLKNKPSDSNISVITPFSHNTENAPNRDEEDSFIPRKSNLKRKRDDIQSQQQQQPSLLDAAIIETLKYSNKAGETQEKDSDFLFCVSLVDAMRAFSPTDNAFVKLKIQQLIFDA